MSKSEYEKWFRQFWTMSGASIKQHPAPFPLELAFRCVRMFLFKSDTVFDPFCGTGTTMLAALRAGRNSIGIEIEPEYARLAAKRIQEETDSLFPSGHIEISTAYSKSETSVQKVMEHHKRLSRKARKREKKVKL